MFNTKEKLLQRALVFHGVNNANSAGNMMIASAENMNICERNWHSLPSLEEIVAYHFDQTGMVAKYYPQLLEIEKRYGKGSVASALSTIQFGENSTPFQETVFVDNISELYGYSVSFLKRVQSLIENRINSAHAVDKAHYEGLLMRIEKLLNAE